MFRLSSLLCTFLFVASTLMTAQVAQKQCDTCFKYFKYDSTLQLGGHQVSDVEMASTRFKWTFSQEYNADGYEMADIIGDDSMNVEWVDSASITWGGFWNDLIFG